MSYVDSPAKKQKHPHYEHRTAKLDIKDNQFTSKKFHHVRKVSTPKKILESFKRIGMCVNGKSSSEINPEYLDKVCFVFINSYKKKDSYLGVGPLNDGYLVGLNHHRLGYKIFYLYNPRSDEFISFLGFFVKHTKVELTVFYSGLNTNGSKDIKFCDGCLSREVVGDVIAQNCNRKSRVLFITDCCDGGSVFDIHAMNPDNFLPSSNLISFFVNKSCKPQSTESKRSHGIFTYYFCKITSDCPNITPGRLVDRINPSLKRFNESFGCDVTEKELIDRPIFSTQKANN